MMIRTRVVVLIISGYFYAAAGFAQSIEVATEEFPPFNYTQDGEIVGLNTKVVKEMFRRAGIGYEISSYPWTRAYNLVLDKPNTAIYTMSRRANREDLFRWVGPIITSQSYLYKRAGNDELAVETLEDAKQYRIAVVRDDVRYSYLIDNGFEIGTNLVILRKYELGWEMLERGRVDIWAMPDQVALHLLDGKGVPRSLIEPVFKLQEVSSSLYHLGLHLNTESEIIDRLQNSLDEMKADSTFQQIADGTL